MMTADSTTLYLAVAGAAVLALALLKGIGSASWVQALHFVDERREQEAKMAAANAAAEAAGRAAALEPLALNADGTIEEPIVGVVEGS